MAKQSSDEVPFRIPSPSRQLAFHQLLLGARKNFLSDAMAHALAEVDGARIKSELVVFAPKKALQVLASAGIRDEFVFPTPSVLAAKPTLLGYYRLLLGASQKSFYIKDTGMSRLKSMEAKGTITETQKVMLPEFCKAMCTALAELVTQVSPAFTKRDVSELQLLTLGSQFQGSNNNAIGKQATDAVYFTLLDLVEHQTTARDQKSIEVRNASGRLVRITLAADPDVIIQEQFGTEWRNKVAIEIKGGTDNSNAHNRAGEAEKSHRKAKGRDFRDFWTLIAKKGLDADVLRKESPTTTSWFDVSQVLARDGNDWEEFKSRLAEVLGIPITT